ncbi:hypothetical protein pb186bvf_011989 [Paramecium bursaria]
MEKRQVLQTLNLFQLQISSNFSNRCLCKRRYHQFLWNQQKIDYYLKSFGRQQLRLNERILLATMKFEFKPQKTINTTQFTNLLRLRFR